MGTWGVTFSWNLLSRAGDEGLGLGVPTSTLPQLYTYITHIEYINNYNNYMSQALNLTSLICFLNLSLSHRIIISKLVNVHLVSIDSSSYHNTYPDCNTLYSYWAWLLRQ
jgi:hypothetical protein